MSKRIRPLMFLSIGAFILLMNGCYTSFAMTMGEPAVRTAYIIEEIDENEDTEIVIYEYWYGFSPVYPPFRVDIPVYYDPWIGIALWPYWRFGYDPYIVWRNPCYAYFDHYYRPSYHWSCGPWSPYYGGYTHHWQDWHHPHYSVWAGKNYQRHPDSRSMTARKFDRRLDKGRNSERGRLADNSSEQRSVRNNAVRRTPTPVSRSGQAVGTTAKTVRRTSNTGTRQATPATSTSMRREKVAEVRSNSRSSGTVVSSRSSAGRTAADVRIRQDQRAVWKPPEPATNRSINSGSVRKNTPTVSRTAEPSVSSRNNRDRSEMKRSGSVNLRKSAAQLETKVNRTPEAVRSNTSASSRSERPSGASSSQAVRAPSSRASSGNSDSSGSGKSSGSQSSGRRRK